LTKVCTKCGVEKSLDDFHKHPRGKYGKSPSCKICNNKKSRAWHAKNKEKATQYNRDWREKNKERFRETSRLQKLKYNYGLSPEEYKQLQIRQCNTCPICHEWLDENVVVDHCHETGRVRGLLHNRCNTAIGLLRDDPELLTNAANYLRMRSY